MRLSARIVVALVVWPVLVLAKPKVAVAPLDGDSDGKLSAIVHETAAIHAKVTSSKVVAKALKELGIDDPDTSKAAKKLRKQLDVDAVIYGKVEQDGKKKKLRLSVYTRGKKPDRFELEYRQTSSKAFRAQLKDELATRLAPDENGNDDADDDPRPIGGDTPVAKDDKPAKPDKPAKSDDDRPAKSKPRADSDDRPSRVAAAGDDDDAGNGSVHKHAHGHKHHEPDRSALTQAALFADAGLGGVHRTLTYVPSAGGTPPPRVGTGAFAVQFDGEIYPGAFDTLDGIAAALGAVVSVNHAVGLSIQIPNATQSAPISETSYTVGARYRIAFGKSSVAFGLSYWAQSFVADRTMLTGPTQLAMADTTYAGIAPGGLLRLAVSPAVALTAQVDIPLMFDSGAISTPSYFGESSVTAFALQAGVDFSVATHFGAHVAGYFDQESLSFKSGMVASATDRTMGVSAALALMY